MHQPFLYMQLATKLLFTGSPNSLDFTFVVFTILNGIHCFDTLMLFQLAHKNTRKDKLPCPHVFSLVELAAWLGGYQWCCHCTLYFNPCKITFYDWNCFLLDSVTGTFYWAYYAFNTEQFWLWFHSLHTARTAFWMVKSCVDFIIYCMLYFDQLYCILVDLCLL